MPILFRCLNCGQRYQIKSQHLGKAMKCRGCGTIIQIPATKAGMAAAFQQHLHGKSAAPATANSDSAIETIEESDESGNASPEVDSLDALEAAAEVEQIAAAKGPPPIDYSPILRAERLRFWAYIGAALIILIGIGLALWTLLRK